MEDSRIGRRGFLALVGASALTACSGSGSSPPRPDVTPTTLPASHFPRDRIFYGASSPVARLSAFEQRLGETLPCYRSFFGAGEAAELQERVRNDAQMARLSITSIKTPGKWAETAANKPWIEGLLGPLGDVSSPVFLAVHHEPEGDPQFGSPDDYKHLQLTMMESASTIAPSVTIVPILGSWSFDERTNRTPSEWNVPEAAVYGIDLYNPWSPYNGKAWVPFIDKLELAAEEAAGRPILVGEYGCRSDPAMPGRAAGWMRDAFTSALESDVVAMAYFNSAQNSPDGTWELDAETFPVFRELLHEPQVQRL
jgi:hypothetical protein